MAKTNPSDASPFVVHVNKFLSQSYSSVIGINRTIGRGVGERQNEIGNIILPVNFMKKLVWCLLFARGWCYYLFLTPALCCTPWHPTTLEHSLRYSTARGYCFIPRQRQRTSRSVSIVAVGERTSRVIRGLTVPSEDKRVKEPGRPFMPSKFTLIQGSTQCYWSYVICTCAPCWW